MARYAVLYSMNQDIQQCRLCYVGMDSVRLSGCQASLFLLPVCAFFVSAYYWLSLSAVSMNQGMSCDALLAVLIFHARVRYLVWFQDHKTDVANLCAAHSTSSEWKQLLLLVEPEHWRNCEHYRNCDVYLHLLNLMRDQQSCNATISP